jgi:hypothetical protein
MVLRTLAVVEEEPITVHLLAVQEMVVVEMLLFAIQ